MKILAPLLDNRRYTIRTVSHTLGKKIRVVSDQDSNVNYFWIPSLKLEMIKK